MRKSIWIISAVMILGGQAFAQQKDSTIIIEFSTIDETLVPVFEVIGQSFGAASISLGRTSGFATGSGVSFQPAFMAPTTMEITNGWHRYQIGESALFSKKFDIIAVGVDQKWLLDAGKPGWNIAGWVMYPIGLMLAIFGA